MCTSNNNDSYDDRKLTTKGGISDSPLTTAGKQIYYNAKSEDFSKFFGKVLFMKKYRTIDEVLDFTITKTGSGGGPA